jgi:hypothetical protein
MATKLVQDYKDLLALLESHSVDYLLVGGYAVGLYGYSRATVDLDIWVRRSGENAKKIEAAVADFGFQLGNVRLRNSRSQTLFSRWGIHPIDWISSLQFLVWNSTRHLREESAHCWMVSR